MSWMTDMLDWLNSHPGKAVKCMSLEDGFRVTVMNQQDDRSRSSATMDWEMAERLSDIRKRI